MNFNVFLFGEAEKGELCTPLKLRSLRELLERFGNPPKDSKGIDYAIQTLLHKRELIFFRVKEEGFSIEDYVQGIKLLYREGYKMDLSAICLPGTGDPAIVESISPICKKICCLLILSETDLYDYLTASKY